MTVAELLERLEDVDPSTEVKLALQPNYPMAGSIQNICIEHDDDNDTCVWIACSGNESYECPREAWDDDEIYAGHEDDE